MQESSAFAEAAVEILDRAGARWAIIGGLAAGKYRATERLTTDADFLVDAIGTLPEAFEQAGYGVRVMRAPGEDPHLLVVRGKGQAIDLLPVTVEYQQVALDRAVDGYITADDVIVHKLIAWRRRDQDDIASILESGHEIDETYVEHWARVWDVMDRWEQIRPRRD